MSLRGIRFLDPGILLRLDCGTAVSRGADLSWLIFSSPARGNTFKPPDGTAGGVCGDTTVSMSALCLLGWLNWLVGLLYCCVWVFDAAELDWLIGLYCGVPLLDADGEGELVALLSICCGGGMWFISGVWLVGESTCCGDEANGEWDSGDCTLWGVVFCTGDCVRLELGEVFCL